MKKFSILIFALIGVIWGMVISQNIYSQEQTADDGVPAQNIQVTPTTAPAPPVSLSIPKLNLEDILIEKVAEDDGGKMAVPENADNVGWFDVGYIPGTPGNAVIAGHFDRVTGAPAVFYNLNKLETGDEIIVRDENGVQKKFIVTGHELYPSDDFPIETVFGPSSDKRLNLITCEGVWDSVNHNYSNRLVVFTKLAE